METTIKFGANQVLDKGVKIAGWIEKKVLSPFGALFSRKLGLKNPLKVVFAVGVGAVALIPYGQIIRDGYIIIQGRAYSIVVDQRFSRLENNVEKLGERVAKLKKLNIASTMLELKTKFKSIDDKSASTMSEIQTKFKSIDETLNDLKSAQKWRWS